MGFIDDVKKIDEAIEGEIVVESSTHELIVNKTNDNELKTPEIVESGTVKPVNEAKEVRVFKNKDRKTCDDLEELRALIQNKRWAIRFIIELLQAEDYRLSQEEGQLLEKIGQFRLEHKESF